MTFWKVLLILIIVIVLSAGAFQLIQTNAELRKKTAALSEKLNKMEQENKYLDSQIEYLKKPENLLKEVKAQFNYRQAGEELIIIVPRD